MKSKIPLLVTALVVMPAFAADQADARTTNQIDQMTQLAKECAIEGAALFAGSKNPMGTGDNSAVDCVVYGSEMLRIAVEKLTPEAKTVAALQELSNWKASVRRALMASIPESDETRHTYLIRQAQQQRVLASASAALSQQLTAKR